MDWPLIVGLASAGGALLLFVSIEYRADDEPLPPPEPICVDKGPQENWEAGEGHVRHAIDSFCNTLEGQ